MKEEMTPMERVEATLRFEEPDRVPIFLPFFPMEIISPEDLLILGKDWKKIVEMNDFVIDRYEVDMVHIHSHQFTFAEALGLKLQYRPDFLPTHGEIYWPDSYVLGMSVDPSKPETMQELVERVDFSKMLEFPTITTKLKSIEVLKKKYPDIPLMGEVDDPFTLLSCLVGVSRFTAALINDPMTVFAFAERALPYLSELVQLQIEAGVDILFTIPVLFGASIADVKVRNNLMVLMGPVLKRAVSEFKEAGAKYIMSHICTNSIYLLDMLEEFGESYDIDIMWVAESADYGVAKRMANGKITITGGPHSMQTFLCGSPRDVEQSVKHTIGQAAPGGGFILSPADGIPEESPQENVDAFVHAAKKWGEYPIPVELQRTCIWDL